MAKPSPSDDCGLGRAQARVLLVEASRLTQASPGLLIAVGRWSENIVRRQKIRVAWRKVETTFRVRRKCHASVELLKEEVNR